MSKNINKKYNGPSVEFETRELESTTLIVPDNLDIVWGTTHQQKNSTEISLMCKRYNVSRKIISKRWDAHKSNQMLTHNHNNNDNNSNICTSKQIANSLFWYVFFLRKVVWDVWGSRNYWSSFVTSDSNVVLLMFSTANNFYVLCSVLYSVIYIHIYVMHIIYIIPHTVMILIIISKYQNYCWCVEQSNSIYIYI